MDQGFIKLPVYYYHACLMYSTTYRERGPACARCTRSRIYDATRDSFGRFFCFVFVCVKFGFGLRHSYGMVWVNARIWENRRILFMEKKATGKVLFSSMMDRAVLIDMID